MNITTAMNLRMDKWKIPNLQTIRYTKPSKREVTSLARSYLTT